MRKNIRLKGFDYSCAGYYFITICVKDRHALLWDAPVGAHSVRPSLSDVGKAHSVRPPLSDVGKSVQTSIENIPEIYNNICIDKYVIMPNHIHMILHVENDSGRTVCAPTPIPRVIKQCKEFITKKIGYSIWQKSYHDHIIRNENEYQKIVQYIDENPARWEDDCYYG